METVGGVFLYQPHILRKELVEALQKELCQLLVAIAADPSCPLADLAPLITPPFPSSTRTRTRRTADTGHTS